MTRQYFSMLAALLLLAVCLPAQAAEIKGVRFAEAAAIGEQTLPLRGTGVMKYRLVFDGYVAALYLPADVKAADVLTDVPKRLELHYFWDIDGEKFGPAGEEILARNVDAKTMAALRAELDEMDDLYVDIKDGDRYALTYVPGVGTTLSHNGKDLGTVGDEAFAAAYFAIWLGKRPLSGGMKEGLLGD